MLLILILSSIIFNSFVQSSILIGSVNITSIQNIDESASVGVWYTILSSTNPFEAYQNCPAYTFSWNPQALSFNLVISTKSAITQKLRIQAASLKRVTDNPKVYDMFYDYILPVGQCVILKSDYKNFAVAVLLYPKLTSNYVQAAFIFSRSTTLSPEHLKIAKDVLTENNIDVKKLKPAVQSNC